MSPIPELAKSLHLLKPHLLRTTFLTLPLEVRLRLYHFINFEKVPDLIIIRHHNPPMRVPTELHKPNIAMTCSQCWEEVKTFLKPRVTMWQLASDHYAPADRRQLQRVAVYPYARWIKRFSYRCY